VTSASPLYELSLERGTGRSFTVSSLGWVVAPDLATPPKRGPENVHAPVFLALVGPSTTLEPFLWNFLDGATASASTADGSRHLRLDPKAPLCQRRREHGGRTLYLAWHLAFELGPDPKKDDQSVEFISMPRCSWLQEQSSRLRRYEDPLRAALAGHVAAFVARRTSMPIPGDADFHLRLFDEMPTEWRREVTKVGLDAHAEPVHVRAPRGAFREWLRLQTSAHLEAVA